MTGTTTSTASGAAPTGDPGTEQGARVHRGAVVALIVDLAAAAAIIIVVTALVLS